MSELGKDLATAFALIGYSSQSWQRHHIGITSEIAIVISMMVGVLCYQEELGLAV